MRFKWFAALAVACMPVTAALADQHTTGVPALSSRPGAAYSVYLNVSGFNFSGAWNGNANLPGTTPSLGGAPDNGTFNAVQISGIKSIFTRMAQSYIGLNVNVTTVDPYAATNDPTPTDAERQAYYDAQPNFLHTVIGSGARPAYVTPSNPDGNWFPGADGVSGLGIAAGVAPYAGAHTNWMFTQAQESPTFVNGEYIGGITAHENAHAFGLVHQGDYTGGVQNAEYSTGDDAIPPDNYGTYVPIIGDANGKQRIAWRNGTANSGNGFVQQNDLKVMLATNSVATATAQGRTAAADLHFVDSGIGHSLATATPLPITGSGQIDFTQAKGVIVPLSESDPMAMGAANYTQDWFSFLSDGLSSITLSAIASTDFLSPGDADSAGTLNATLGIFNSSGMLIATGTEDNTTLIDSYMGTLAAGQYYAAIGSFGGHQQVNAANYDPSFYFDTGAYFLTGSGFVVPEPTSMVFIAMAAYGLMGRRRSNG